MARSKSKTPAQSEPLKVRTSFYIYADYKRRIGACLDEGRLAKALPMSCDDMAAFINGAIERELLRVEEAIKHKPRK